MDKKVHDAPGFFLFSMKNLLQAIQELDYLFLDFIFHICNRYFIYVRKEFSWTYFKCVCNNREIQAMAEKTPIWDKDKLDARNEKLVDFVINKI